MSDALYPDILQAEGFQLIGRLDYRLSISAWWNPSPDYLLQVLVLSVDPLRFHDVLRAVVKEIMDQHRYQVQQKLQGGRLNIHVAECDQPAIAWIEQWFGGALSPKQLARISSPPADLLRQAGEDRLIVTPDEPIFVDGHVRAAEKHLAARFVSTVLQRLDKTDPGGHKPALDPDNIPPEAMPLRIGLRLDEAGHALGPAVFPLNQIVHACISGTTGSGKSFLARVLVEEAAQHKDLSILVLDPRNQFVGLLVPEDRPPILQQYDQFGMKPEQARGFAFGYFGPALPCASPLPPNLSSLASGRSIVSFKGTDDRERCLIASQILDAAFQTISAQESERPRLLIVVDEAQLLTRRRVDESAKDAAAQAERALDRFVREARKYGGVMVLLSQSVKDFSYELASLRQMATTKIFLRNSDREIEYASDIVGDGKTLVQLPTGTALVHNANWGFSFARVSAVVGMNVGDFQPRGKRFWFRFLEKGSKVHDVPAHHKAEQYLDEYMTSASIASEGKGPLFRTLRSRKLTVERMTRSDVLRMVKRRVRAAGLSAKIGCHSFRATGITAYLENGGTIEHAQAIAAHESPRTTKLYDRTTDPINLTEIERVRI